MPVVGLVVEGTHDYVMLEPLIEHEIREKFKLEVKFKHLQPTPDATGGHADGGWDRVKGWCDNYAGDQIETFFTPLFETDEICDLIVIHVDGDVVELANLHKGKNQLSVRDRVKTISNSIESWLNCPKEHSKKIIHAIPVLQTEAWILASEGISYENKNSKSEFRKTYTKSKDGKIKDYYRSRSTGAKAGYANAHRYCTSYNIFRGSIRSASL